MRIDVRLPGGRPVEFLAMDPFETREQLKIEEMAKGKGDRTLAMGIDILFLDAHLGPMAQHPLQHGRHFGRRHGLQLRINTDRAFLHVPIHLSQGLRYAKEADETYAIPDVSPSSLRIISVVG